MGRTLTARATVVAAITAVAALGACSSSGSGGAKSARTTSTSAAAATRLPRVTVEPATGLHDGQTVAVTATAFPPSTGVAVEQCADRGRQTAPGDCDFDRTVSLTTDAAGNGHTSLTVHTGPFGKHAVSCSATERCLVVVAVVPGHTGVNATAPLAFA